MKPHRKQVLRRAAACATLLALLAPTSAFAKSPAAAPEQHTDAAASSTGAASEPEAQAASDRPAEPSTVPTPQAASEPIERPAPARTADPSDETDLRNGKIVRNSGIAMGAFGVVMLGAFGGLHAKYKQICSDTLGSEDLERTCNDSRRANIAVATTGVAFLVGAAVLIGLGQHRVGRARRNMERRAAFVPTVGPGSAGAVFVGRF